ncbi:MAG: DUF488 domain-containing protein [Chloroflexi bacterium]|nr:DUF488 domain-containing protein [Chloroflexota bacterium]
MIVYTIGHSNQQLDTFVQLLRKHGIEALVDVRSSPVSTYAAQFNEKELKAALPPMGVKYLYMGKELGGRPSGAGFYDAKRRVLYDQVAQSPNFSHGIERLKLGLKSYRIAIMCSEEAPINCHRRLLIGHVLIGAGIEVVHIRGDGSLQTEATLSHFEQQVDQREPQLTLFESPGEYKAWRSAKPIP